MSDAADKPRRGRLIVIAAPSGAGKTTLVHALLMRMPDLKFSVSYTTRARRPAEEPGKDYFFVSEEEFARMVKERALLEHARVFDHWYGTGREHVSSLLESGTSVLLEIDWQGARQVKQRVPDALTIFILPPSMPELERRLRGRATDSEETIRRRLRDAAGDMTHWTEFDYALVNEDAESAAEELAAIVAGDASAHATSSPALRARVAAILGSS
ncbi:MAG TPA: guanylate kinase [Gammaproteobacteria bacterium]